MPLLLLLAEGSSLDLTGGAAANLVVVWMAKYQFDASVLEVASK